MSKRHLILAPQKVGTIDRGWWFYEEGRGITVVIEPKEHTYSLLIPWQRIRASLRRKDAKP